MLDPWTVVAYIYGALIIIVLVALFRALYAWMKASFGEITEIRRQTEELRRLRER